MRSRRRLRISRPLQLAVGALLVTIPVTAVALGAGQADAQSAIQMNVSANHLRLGQRVTVTGTAPGAGAGQTILLEYARSGSSNWKVVGSTRSAAGGGFRFVAPLQNSGLVRVGEPFAGSGSPAVGTVLPQNATSNPGAAGPSAPRNITVGSKFQLHRRMIGVLSGHRARITGRLLPGVRGRVVRLEGRTGRHWRVLGAARTGRRGGFQIRYRAAGSLGARGESLRVAFRGDSVNTGSAGSAGRLIVFRPALTSWYYDGGSTGCGFHAGLGVANKTLPCGTRVTFRFGGRTVTAVVDDRGPYVGAREFDLNQNTAAALGFSGVGTVWTTS